MTEMYWNVCAATVIAWGCWVVGMSLVLLSCAGILSHPFSALGGIVSMFGCMTMLRCWMQRSSTATAEAFALGRASMSVVRD